MKKIILSLAIVSMFGFAGITHASCGNPALNHPEQYVFDPITLSTTTIPAVNNSNCDGVNPENVVSAWGRNGDVPHLKPGEFTPMDKWGFKYQCPAWFGNYCVDITNTSYYITVMTKAFGAR